MSGAEIVALVSVVVTGLAAPWIGSHMARKQAELQTRHAREDELRAVLENAGVKLTEAAATVGKTSQDLRALDEGEVALLGAEIEQLWKNDDRVRVRLGGNSPEARHYRRAITEGISAAHTVFLKAVTSGIDDDPGFEAGFEALRKAQEIALNEQEAFYQAASHRIGPGARVLPGRVRLVRGESTDA